MVHRELYHRRRKYLSLPKKGIERLYKNVVDIKPQFVDDLLLETLLTTVVENLHAVSHLKHEIDIYGTYICKRFWNNLQGISEAHI